jgi:hypothetical protein
MKKLLAPITLSTMFLLASCGSDSTPTAQMQQQQLTEGHYRVSLQAMNGSFGGETSGEGTFHIEGDEVRVTMKVNNAPSTVHMQHVHAGRSCPTMAADTNGDGVIDGAEALASAGGVLIPLNGNLNAQVEGRGMFPFGGQYSYSRSGVLSRMLADLRMQDDNVEDHLVKLDADEELNLAGRVVMIYGVTELAPMTAAQAFGRPSWEAIPVACGVIERTTESEITE